MKTSEVTKGAAYDKQCADLRRARKIRNRLLALPANRFTVGELMATMKEPHFSTSSLDLETLIEVSDGKPVLTEFE